MANKYPGKTVVRAQTQGGMITEDRVYDGDVNPNTFKDMKVLQSTNSSLKASGGAEELDTSTPSQNTTQTNLKPESETLPEFNGTSTEETQSNTRQWY